MNKNTIWSIILVLLILGSVIGMSIGSRPDSIDDENYPEDENYQEPASVSYSTQLNTIVKDTYPEIIVVSKTEVFEKESIENDLIEIDGINRVTIEFSKSEEDIIVIIRMVINEDNKNNIIENIKNLNYLISEPIEFYKQGVIDINEKITFESYDDENVTLDYDFIDQRVDAIIDINSNKEDEVYGELQAVFKGEKIDYLTFIELKTVSSSPELVESIIDLNLDKWVEEYKITLESSIENKVKSTDLNNLFENNIEIINKTDTILSFENINDINLNIEDFNSELIQDVFTTEKTIDVYTKENIEYQEYLNVLNILEDKNISKKYLISEPKNIYEIIVDNNNFEDIDSKITDFNLELNEITQKGILDITEIIINDVSYNYQEDTYTYWFTYPNDVEKDNYEFYVQAYVMDKDIMFLMLEQK